MMLSDCELLAFAPTVRPEKAKVFYRDVLGLKLEDDNPFALIFRAGRTILRIQKVKEFSPFPFTLLGWTVSDIKIVVQQLNGKGVRLERFEGMEQDALGIWLSPGGSKVAWFKDPDGNLLSLTEAA
jgi:catechol 2,3-dioxygenase-like lactoylglutathione lyase family enzyme